MTNLMSILKTKKKVGFQPKEKISEQKPKPKVSEPEEENYMTYGQKS
jgi:hypothetical protein